MGTATVCDTQPCGRMVLGWWRVLIKSELKTSMKEVKASLTGGTSEENAVRAELPEGGR